MTLNIGMLWPQTSAEWPGGTIYAENLLKSIAMGTPGQRITLVVPVGGEEPSMLSAVPDLEISVEHYVPVSRTMPPTQVAVAYLNRRLGRADRSLAKAVVNGRIDVMFGNLIAQVSFPVPWVGWIPDFQFLHYPDAFGTEDVSRTIADYRTLCDRAAIVLLSSRNALADMGDLYPDAVGKARVLPFVSVMADDLFTLEPGLVVERFAIRRPFVVVPNQWWRYKNHETAIQAAALLRDSGVDCQWVFTGPTNDRRHPKHTSHMLQRISELQLRDVVVPLGFLSRADQVQLMRAADCIVQPSLFEGWSTVVEDARTLGQRVVLSDLAVHREQDPPAALFFETLSASALAEAVRRVLDGALDRVDEATARARMRAAAGEVGRAFLEVCEEAAAGGRL
jgi:glycosyltransferase involved in cell wall biosynthesis